MEMRFEKLYLNIIHLYISGNVEYNALCLNVIFVIELKFCAFSDFVSAAHLQVKLFEKHF